MKELLGSEVVKWGVFPAKSASLLAALPAPEQLGPMGTTAGGEFGC